MIGQLGRLLIVNHQLNFARRIGLIAERLGLTTRILPHTLDLEYVMQHWHPEIVAVHMEMPDQQDLEVLEFLEHSSFSGQVLMTGDAPKSSLQLAADVARHHGLTVSSVLTANSSDNQVEEALRLLRGIERAA
jgi:hypothetical protein